MLVAPDARVVPVLVGVVALAVYVLPRLPAPAAHWPLWDVRVYWWGGRQATAGGGAVDAGGAGGAAGGGAGFPAPAACFTFPSPPFAALLFSAFADASAGAMKIVLTAG